MSGHRPEPIDNRPEYQHPVLDEFGRRLPDNGGFGSFGALRWRCTCGRPLAKLYRGGKAYFRHANW